jgi:hypothetical protein
MSILKKAVSRKRLYTGSFILAVSIVVAIILIHLQPQYFYYMQKKNMSPIVKSERAYLAAQLRPLGITLSQLSKVSCGWNPDPQLDFAECSQQAYVHTPAYNVSDAAAIEQKVNTLDAELTKQGWVHGSNDYRHHGAWASWPVMLQQGLILEYDNAKSFGPGDPGLACDLQVSIRADTQISYGPTFNELYCNTTTTYFWLSTPKKLD